MEASQALASAREAYSRRDWDAARDGFATARELDELAPDDVLAQSAAAWWLGRVDEALATGEEAYRHYLHGKRPRQAAMAAIGMAVDLFLRGDDVLGSGWMSRAQRLLAEEPEHVEHGYLRYITGVEAKLGDAELDEVIDSARQVQTIGHRHADPNLVAAGTLGEGRALVKAGRVGDGLALLDEAMLAVLADDLKPVWAGNIYCHLMSAFHELADIRRAAALTQATTHWLHTLPAAVLFTGICRVHRSQTFQVKGAWLQAEQEASRVCDELRDIHVGSVAEGHYQVGELRRLRGDLAGAGEAYQQAHQRGRDPQPGLALLLLAQGRADAASASVATALASAQHDRLTQFRLHAAAVEIAVARSDTASARNSCAELAGIASVYDTSGITATTRWAEGAVLLAEGKPAEALPVLRDACRRWREVGAPYDAARVGMLLARACEQLGDADAARRELDSAAAVFDRVGATPDAQRVAMLRNRPELSGGLTAREAEVLTFVAGGRTNREIADALVISERTVHRHVSNIFAKLNLSSRSALTAYAFEHGLAALRG